MRGYPRHLVDHILSEVKFTERESALKQRQKTQNKPLPFVTQYHPSVPDLKRIFMAKWHWIENQPLLREIYKEPPFISYRKGKSLKDILVKVQHHHEKWELFLVCQHCFHLSTFVGEERCVTRQRTAAYETSFKRDLFKLYVSSVRQPAFCVSV